MIKSSLLLRGACAAVLISLCAPSIAQPLPVHSSRSTISQALKDFVGLKVAAKRASTGGHDQYRVTDQLLMEKIRAVAQSAGFNSVRMLFPDSQLTLEYSDSRLTVIVNEQGVIEEMRPG